MQKRKTHLSTTREQLLKEIFSLEFDEFNKSLDPQKWNIAQVCHHLYLTETLFTKVIITGLDQKKDSTVERKPIEVVLDRSKKFQAPSISKPSSDPFLVSEITQLLSYSRANILDVLNGIGDVDILRKVTMKHPILEDLTLEQWVELLYLHELRHIEQIKELKDIEYCPNSAQNNKMNDYH